MKKTVVALMLIAFFLVPFNTILFAEDFYFVSPRNKGTLQFEIDNDADFIIY